MKYLVILSLVGLVGCASAPPPQLTKHDLAFTAQATHTPKRVEWIVMEDVSSVCQGFAPIKEKEYIACARFNNQVCKVYTKPNLTLSILGHEMRHCFEGHWH